MSNQEKYDQAFINTFGVEKDALNDQFNFGEVSSWDSISHLTLISELEDAFDVMFETDDILHFGGYQHGRKILAGYGVDFDA